MPGRGMCPLFQGLIYSIMAATQLMQELKYIIIHSGNLLHNTP